jgi:acyl-coenzyme A synthetase/AMP-(fatty) acid ligase/acyl carrier protein
MTAGTTNAERPGPGFAAGTAPTRCPVVTAFEHQVDAGGDRVAVVLPDGMVSYAELDARANAVAQELLARRGDQAEPVPLMVLDPAWMLAVAFGVLKAGKFYVPLNPLHPPAHNRELLRQLGAAVVITDDAGPQRPVVDEVDTIVAGALAAIAEGCPRPSVPVDPRQWAYVLYTSGSTGRPKWIMQNRVVMYQNTERHAELGIGPADRVTLISADGFVAAVSNPYTALLNGAALVPYSFKRDGVHDLVRWLDKTGVTVYYSFPSFLREVAAVSDGQALGIRLAYLGGETVHHSDVLAARELFPGSTVAVGLNSTETGLTRLRTIAPDAPVPDPVPVGGSVSGVEVRVVDESGADVPVGEAGEIVVRSTHVRPVLFSEGGPVELTKNVPGHPGLREFHTSDRGRFDQAGELVHLGRCDSMVKVRGYRVEIAEVEAAVAAVRGVAEAAVVPYQGAGPGETELAAHVVAKDPTLGAADVRRLLAHTLPAALVPASVVLTDQLPRTANGKVDRIALSALGRPTGGDGLSVASAVDQGHAPADTTSARIADIWCDVLDIDRPRPGDDFFDLGGTSISALRVVSRIRREFNVPIPLAVLFETPTVEALAEAVMDVMIKE